AVQAQLGSGSGLGAAVRPGDPEIRSPENGGDRGTPGGGGTIEPGQDSGKVRPEGAIIMKPKPGEAGAPGSGRPPDRSTPNPSKGSSGGNSSGMRSGSGSAGSSGGTGG